VSKFIKAHQTALIEALLFSFNYIYHQQRLRFILNTL